MPTFTDLSRAAYCPRQLYYARREDDRTPPPEAVERRNLAFRYSELRRADDAALAAEPADLAPEAYRAALSRLAERDDWDELADPTGRMVRLDGRDCRGVAHKVLEGGEAAASESRAADGHDDADGDDAGERPPPVPVVVSPGAPPESGVWEPQRVRAVAAAKALSWERERRVERALVEYPARAVVREVRLTTRNKATYRRTLRTVRGIDGPPPRLRASSKCGSCEYRTECGVRTRSLRSILGL